MRRLRFPDELDAATFLRRYWQKAPLFIVNAFDPCEFELCPDELAGLALEDDVESRLVQAGPDELPKLQEPPFSSDDFSELPARGWTLLVQDVDKHLPELQSFLDYFDFVPCWRLDDLMVSAAAAGGGVGPHIDQYDVFLCQASGHRRWQIGERGNYAESQRGGLRQIERFVPGSEYLAGPGDVLYLPPGIPHDGVAQDLCTTWSVGFRAPAATELIAAGFPAAAAAEAAGRRYEDADLQLREAKPGLISTAAIRRFQKLLELTDHEIGDDFISRLGEFLTTPKPWLAPESREAISPPAALIARLQSGEHLVRHGMALLAHAHWQGQHWLFASGTSRPVDSDSTSLAELLCQYRSLNATELCERIQSRSAATLLTSLYNDGQFLFVGEQAAQDDEIRG